MTEPSSRQGARRPASPGRGAALPRHVRLWMRLARRDLRELPPAECGVRVDAGLTVPAADGSPLRTDHYIPQVASPRPTVLVRTLQGPVVRGSRLAGEQARPDVLVFTSAPLTGPLDVIGPVSARVRVRASSGHFDLFARLCDVDPRGRSRNVCDGIIRCDAGSPTTGTPTTGTPTTGTLATISVPMSATAYRFAAGHRLRLQVSGGAHPRFARNTGSGEPPATTTRLVVVDLQMLHEVDDPCSVLLPVLPGRSGTADSNGTLGRHHQPESGCPAPCRSTIPYRPLGRAAVAQAIPAGAIRAGAIRDCPTWRPAGRPRCASLSAASCAACARPTASPARRQAK